jgi:hypothetical protein
MNDDRNGVPPELEGFSWSAFLWGGIWALAHRVWIGALAFVPGLGFIMHVVLGFNGARWAWQAGAITDVARFKKAQRTWVVVWLAVSLLAVPAIIGIGSAIAIFGVRKYLINAKQAEARNVLVQMAKGMASCGARGDLPETSDWVPSDIAMIKGKKYQSDPLDWSGKPAFACGGFAFSGPQYFRYRWLQATTASGQFEAEADLDGDGLPDNAMQLGLHCVAGACVIEPLLGPPPSP